MRWLAASILFLGVVTVGVFAQDNLESAKKPPEQQPAKLELKTNLEKVSYGIGLNIGRSLKRDDLNLDPALVGRGLADALTGAAPSLTDEELQTAFGVFQQEMQARQAEARKAEAEKNKKAGEAYLAANLKKEGVKATKSGLQYKVIREGDGKSPTADDVVTTHYEGKLIDGTVFDSSYAREQPATFPVSGVIKGWTEALQMMKVGSKWQLFIPAELAYGENPRPGGPIGPNSVLVFEVELLSIDDK